MPVVSPDRHRQSKIADPRVDAMARPDRTRASDGTTTSQEWMAKLAPMALLVNLALLLAVFIGGNGLATLNTLTENFMAIGRLCGLVAIDLVLVQLFLMSRMPWIDRTLGRDKLTAYHRLIGQWSFYSMVAHIIFIVLAYSRLASLTFVSQVGALVLQEKWMLFAAAAFGCFVMVVVTSIRAARKRMQFESWHFIHFYAYLAIALAFPHQLVVGGTFATTPLAVAFWTGMYAVCIGAVLWFRFTVPVRNHRRHQLRVTEIVRESDDTISIYMSGLDLPRLQAKAGQYFNWRFLDRDNWTAAHPFSLSAAPPQGFENAHDRLRITVKQSGAGTRKLEHIDPGTPVMAEGPYGAFTNDVRTRRRVLFVAGGVGVTPIRALLEALPARTGDISMIYRAHSQEDLVFIDEIRALAARRRMFLHVVLGGREEFPDDFPPLGADHLEHVAPDIVERDVFVCGSAAMTQFVVASLEELGVPRRQVHFESFAS